MPPAGALIYGLKYGLNNIFAAMTDNNAIARAIVRRVLFEPHLRRGQHDVCGIRC